MAYTLNTADYVIFTVSDPEEESGVVLIADLEHYQAGPGTYKRLKWQIGGYPPIDKPFGQIGGRRHLFQCYIGTQQYYDTFGFIEEWSLAQDWKGSVEMNQVSVHKDGTPGDTLNKPFSNMILDRVVVDPRGYKGPFCRFIDLIFTEQTASTSTC